MQIFHASGISGIEYLEPRVSNHGKPLVYFSVKRENVLPYLSNAVEKYCKEIGFVKSGGYYKWCSYGFTKNGILELQEYYPNAIVETYKGVSGYIYTASLNCKLRKQDDIPFSYCSEHKIKTDGYEFIPDAYNELTKAEGRGLIKIKYFEQNDENKLAWIKRTVISEYEKAKNIPEYKLFLEAKFKDILL